MLDGIKAERLKCYEYGSNISPVKDDDGSKILASSRQQYKYLEQLLSLSFGIRKSVRRSIGKSAVSELAKTIKCLSEAIVVFPTNKFVLLEKNRAVAFK